MKQHIHTYLYTHIHIHPPTYAHIHTYTPPTYAHIHIHTYIHTCTWYIHIRTYTQCSILCMMDHSESSNSALVFRRIKYKLMCLVKCTRLEKEQLVFDFNVWRPYFFFRCFLSSMMKLIHILLKCQLLYIQSAKFCPNLLTKHLQDIIVCFTL